MDDNRDHPRPPALHQREPEARPHQDCRNRHGERVMVARRVRPQGHEGLRQSGPTSRGAVWGIVDYALTMRDDLTGGSSSRTRRPSATILATVHPHPRRAARSSTSWSSNPSSRPRC
ncbi:MAG: hypothetical protein ACLTSX_01055 [Collinsella sp.]